MLFPEGIIICKLVSNRPGILVGIVGKVMTTANRQVIGWIGCWADGSLRKEYPFIANAVRVLIILIIFITRLTLVLCPALVGEPFKQFNAKAGIDACIKPTGCIFSKTGLQQWNIIQVNTAL